MMFILERNKSSQVPPTTTTMKPWYVRQSFDLFLACVCDDLRLSGAESYFEGRLEVCSEGQLDAVTICDDSWDDIDAQVVCSELGFFAPGRKLGREY